MEARRGQGARRNSPEALRIPRIETGLTGIGTFSTQPVSLFDRNDDEHKNHLGSENADRQAEGTPHHLPCCKIRFVAKCETRIQVVPASNSKKNRSCCK